jgi:AcrR family transcriptional regulator
MRRFSRHGFHQTSMRDICREARLSPGAVYNYFRGKDDIIRRLAEMGKAQTETFVAPSGESPGLKEILVRFLSILSDKASAQGFQLDVRLWGEALHDRRLKQIFQNSRNRLLTFLTRAVRGASAPGMSELSVSTARLFSALIAGLELEKAMAPEIDFTPLIPALNRLVENLEG